MPKKSIILIVALLISTIISAKCPIGVTSPMGDAPQDNPSSAYPITPDTPTSPVSDSPEAPDAPGSASAPDVPVAPDSPAVPDAPDSPSSPQNDFDPDALEKAPDFTLPDNSGNEFTLSSMRGKYVVLEFWGTWCAVCIKGLPKLKEYYKRYQGKFEIVAVDCGDTEDRWKKVVQVLNLPWKNVQVGRDNGVSRLYHVNGFPTKVIIDPQGNIVKTIQGEDPRFYATLDKLFK